MDTNKNDGQDTSDKKLDSSEYRARLLTKLNCLVAVLEVAIAKISRSMDLPGANQERLLKIRSNLENTLSICKRAKHTLESGAPRTSGSRAIATASAAERRKMTFRDYVELSSIDEYKKFKQLPPISSADVDGADIDRLISKLLER